MTDDNKTGTGNDDWLDDLEGGEEAGVFGELDQDTIDQLLGGSGGDGSKQAAPKENGATGGGSVEIDQASLDQLFSGSGDDGPKQAAPKENGAAGGGSVEIDQASLDALLNGHDAGDSDDFFASGSGGAADVATPLDQSSINALFGNDEEDFQAALEDSSNVPSQSDIDELFAQALEEGGEPPGPPGDDADLNDLFAEGQPAGSPAAGEEDFGFDTDGFEMDEATAPGKRTAAAPPVDQDATMDEDIFGEETLLGPTVAATTGAKPSRKLVPGRLLAGVSQRALWGGLLAAVLVVGGGFSLVALRSRAPEPIAPPPVAMPSPAPKAAPAVANIPPEAKGVEFRMPEAGGEVPLLLAAKDQEGAAITYEITKPPQHGRLSGKLPTPIYLPNNDFPGQDLVEYRVSDGKDFSKPASVLITGPDLRPETGKEQPATPAVTKPRQPVLQARDITLKTLSTRELVIDWRKIWQAANGRPLPPEARVEIFDKGLHGELKTLDPRMHHYRPDRLFRGSEMISYRFRLGETASKMAELRLLVEPGDFPPVIRLREPPAASYLVGETVVLDASPTEDDEPAALTFTWRQEGGTPVKVERLNAEGSRISFVVPSSFSTQENPGPVLRLIATDSSGQKADKLVKIATRSRHQSPLWRGVALNGGLSGPEARPGPSALLPGVLGR